MFGGVNFPGDRFEGIFVPKPSWTQSRLYEGLFKLCLGEEKFDGPFQEFSVSRCSMDTGFISLKGNIKLAYEVDGPTHNPDKDRVRDLYLKRRRGWLVFRVDCKEIDRLGFDRMVRMIYCHALYQFGFIEEKLWDPNVITSYTVLH